MMKTPFCFPGKSAAIAICLFSTACLLKAGPPFVTDDPEPVAYRHWEVNLASQLNHDAGGWSGTSPHLEINYGAVPNLQVHMIAPLAFVAPAGEPARFGYGDTELGLKYRFVQQTKSLPQIGVFPTVELPTGDAGRGLGTGHTDIYLPIWFQKNFGQWTTYGGGGYWINPGPENRNWWFAGWLIQRQIASNLALGAEIFYETAKVEGGQASAAVNAGGIWDLSERYHLMFSAGHTIKGSSAFQGYAALQVTFGPAEPK